MRASRWRNALGTLTVVTGIGLMFGTGTAAAAPFPGTATVSLPAKADLIARVLVEVPVTYSCTPVDGQTSDGSNITARIRQAVHQSTAFGFGGATEPATCDGAVHTQTVQVLAGESDLSAAHFRKGEAIAIANISVCGSINGVFGCERAVAGWKEIRLF
jgi:hypothetical protein